MWYYIERRQIQPQRYDGNIVESGVKHHQTNKQTKPTNTHMHTVNVFLLTRI